MPNLITILEIYSNYLLYAKLTPASNFILKVILNAVK